MGGRFSSILFGISLHSTDLFIFNFLIYGKTPSFRWVKKEKFQGNPKIRITILNINSAKVSPTLLSYLKRGKKF